MEWRGGAELDFDVCTGYSQKHRTNFYSISPGKLVFIICIDNFSLGFPRVLERCCTYSRLWTHRPQDGCGQDRDHLLRHPGHPADRAVLVQHWRRHGERIQVSYQETTVINAIYIFGIVYKKVAWCRLELPAKLKMQLIMIQFMNYSIYIHI